MSPAHGRAGRDLIGIHAALAHGFGQHAFQLHVLRGFVNMHATHVAGDPQQLLGHGGNHDDPQILIHGDDAVLHLVHDHAHGLIGAALVEDALVDAIQNGVIFLPRFGAEAAVFRQAGVKVSVREGIQHAHDPFHGKPAPGVQNDQHHEKGHADNKKNAHVNAGGFLENGIPEALLCHGYLNIGTVLQHIGGAKNRFAVRSFGFICARSALTCPRHVFLAHRLVKTVGSVNHLTAGGVNPGGNAPVAQIVRKGGKALRVVSGRSEFGNQGAGKFQIP